MGDGLHGTHHHHPLAPIDAARRDDGRGRRRAADGALRQRDRPHRRGHRADSRQHAAQPVPRRRAHREHHAALLRRRPVPRRGAARLARLAHPRHRGPHRLGQRGAHRARLRDRVGEGRQCWPRPTVSRSARPGERR